MSKEFWLHRIISMHYSCGIVHIEAEVADWDDEGNIINIEWNAKELLDDIPSLYEFAMKAEEEELKNRNKKYKELKQKL